jgi:hypothetical protein
MSKGEYKDYIAEARRYLANAKNILKNSKVENEGSFQKLTKRCLNISTQRTIYYTFRVIMMERIGSALYPMA